MSHQHKDKFSKMAQRVVIAKKQKASQRITRLGTKSEGNNTPKLISNGKRYHEHKGRLVHGRNLLNTLSGRKKEGRKCRVSKAIEQS